MGDFAPPGEEVSKGAKVIQFYFYRTVPKINSVHVERLAYRFIYDIDYTKMKMHVRNLKNTHVKNRIYII